MYTDVYLFSNVNSIVFSLCILVDSTNCKLLLFVRIIEIY